VRGLNALPNDADDADDAPLDVALAAIDAANALDPTTVVVRGEQLPLALAHGRLASAWISQLIDDADDTLLLAARAHHLRRWEVPRATYPEGKAGYLRWRKDQKARHARDVEALLVAAGYPSPTIERVQALIRRDDLGHDDGAQAIEDAAALAFLETQLGDLAGKLDHGHVIEVLRKTARKLSPAGLIAAAQIPLDDAERALLIEALG
jgi:hypothetical protein